MASQEQIQANRRNAQNSSGPKRPEGKAASSGNALKHGLLARDAVIPEEDRQQFLKILATFEAEHRPSGPLETFLVSQMAAAEWRLRRISRIETGLLVSRLQSARDFDSRKSQHDASLTPRQEYQDTTRLLGVSFHQNVDSFVKLSRYENMIRRSFYKALQELRSRQASRTGPQQDPQNVK